MVDHPLLVEVQHLKINRHVVQHLKKIVLIHRQPVLKTTKHRKTIDTKIVIAMIEIVIHLLIVVHQAKIVHHHRIDHLVIEVVITNMNDLVVIENLLVIEMINTNVILESKKIRFCSSSSKFFFFFLQATSSRR